MTSSGTFRVHFVLRSNRQQNGKSSVYARITVNGTCCELVLKEYLYPADWNAGKFPEMIYQNEMDYIFDSSKFEKKFGMKSHCS